MLYPEEPITWCDRCDKEVPLSCIWRGRGMVINRRGQRRQARALFSVCPRCGVENCVPLEGNRLTQILYNWLWGLRYPNTRPVRFEELLPSRMPEPVEEQPRRRRVANG